MDIDFIKWMVGYAEGFEWGKETVTYQHSSWLLGRLHDQVVTWGMYPLLLQRAIEGVNDSEKYRWKAPILQNRGYIEVVGKKDIVVGGTDAETYDPAKEQALKYIYEQETK